MIVTHLPNVRYLTGFSGSNAVLVLGEDADADLIGTDGRYVDQVAMEAPGLPTVRQPRRTCLPPPPPATLRVQPAVF